MLNISTSQPLSWPTAPPMPAAPVQAVPGVGAAQPSARDPQADPGRNGQGSRNGAPSAGRSGQETAAGAPTAQPAPLLPRERKDGERRSPADDLAEARLKAEQRQEDEQKAREQAEQKLQLQEVLATVWKASAAVVDVVLGREPSAPAANDAEGGATSAAATTATAPESVQAELPGMEAVPAGLRRDPEPVAYTEQGASSWAPLEAGSLISHRV
jgi:hypothetical protein